MIREPTNETGERCPRCAAPLVTVIFGLEGPAACTACLWPDDDAPVRAGPEGGGMMACWCGEKRPYFETSPALLSSSCAGTGELDCLCGGDQCVCHNHGTVECDGCGDCDFGGEDQ